MRHILFGFLAFSLCAGSAPGAIIWDEATVQGDLSGNNLAPTPLTLAIGANSVKGTMGRDSPSDPLDRDFFTFTLPAGRALTSINVVQFVPVGLSFYAIASGTSINITDPANHLSNVLVSGLGEILDDLDAGSYSGGLGLTAPLGPGTYTVWFQEVSSVVTYQMDYTVVATDVPEPGSSLLFGTGVATATCLRRRKSRDQRGPLARNRR